MSATRGKLVLAYATVYLVWGSSYLFMKFAVESLPPFPMAGVRFLLAGIVLCGVAWVVSKTPGTRAEWRSAAIVGTALMGSNALVAFSVTRIPSGVAALLVAMTPCWMVLFDWLHDRKQRPRRGVFAGLALGLLGIAVLVGPGELLGGAHTDPLGAAAVLTGTLLWAGGSIYARRGARPASAQLMSGMQMIAGGAVLVAVSFLTDEWSGFSVGAVTTRSWFAFVYLVLVASLAGFTAYVYLLTNASPARASTYAYVNPVVAVALGAVFGGESLSPRVGVAAAVIVAAVALIVTAGAPGERTQRHAPALRGG
ncbi:MAG: EamA family transporter [Gemmatimonadaceae bacterium]